jgi:deoxyadenosine/deoxycytidine kinase
MKNRPYIGFEGPIGAGKTTLAQLLAAHLGATLVLEDFEGNEFLSDFYRDKQRWSLAMQLTFLVSRHRQLLAVPSKRLRPVVADYTYAKDGIFARTLLHDRELRLYNNINSSLTESLAVTDLVVYLDAHNEVLLERIRRRNRAYENSIDTSYLDTVRDAYWHYLELARNVKVLRYDSSNLNLGSKSQLDDLYRTIHSAHSGTI